MLNPRQMREGESKGEAEAGLCELRQRGIFYLKVGKSSFGEGEWGQWRYEGGEGLYLDHTKHAKGYQEEHP